MKIEGIVNVLKPPGMTSGDVVSDIRRIFNIKRVGHTGTLDPGAAGVLPICLGRATRLFDILVDKDKEYIAEIAFGVCTDTQDSYGAMTERDDKRITREELEAVLPHFTGRQQQIAPAYSAVKHEGKALYAIARRGGEVPRRVREVEIHSIRLIDQMAENRFLIQVHCTRGTYIRTLCEDIGRSLQTCAHLSFLLRTASGAFRIDETYSIQRLTEMKEELSLRDAIVPVEEAVCFLPEIRLSHHAKSFLNGVAIDYEAGDLLRDQPLCRVYDQDAFLGIGMYAENRLKMQIRYLDTEDGS